jgi:hypothetical protein
MEHPILQKDTSAWIFQVWASFLLATLSTGLGILYLPVDGWMKGFLGMGLLFTVGSCFSLAKTIRDNHESSKLLNRITDAKTEKILREYEMKTDVEGRIAS